MTVIVKEIYTFDQHAAKIDMRYPSRFEIPTLTDESDPDKLRQHHIGRGLQKNDFGFFVHVLTDVSADYESFLMTSYMDKGLGVIIPSDTVMASPGRHLTAELARKIALVEEDCIRQFGLSSLIDAVKKQYPGIK
jgi:hypothetical protein